MKRQDVLEHNVARLFARAYRPVEVRAAFRADLRARCLDAAGSVGPAHLDPSTPRRGWRPVLALAAAGLAALVGWRVLGGPSERDDASSELRFESLSAILASGRVALRVVDGRAPVPGEGALWRAAEGPAAGARRIPLNLAGLESAAVLEVVTPNAVPADSQAAGRASYWSFDLGLGEEPNAGLLLDRETRITLRRAGAGAVALDLAHGWLQAQRPRLGSAGLPWQLAGPAERATPVRFERGALTLSWRPGEDCARALLASGEGGPRRGGDARAFDALERSLPLHEWVTLCPGESRSGQASGQRREPAVGAAQPAAEPAIDPAVESAGDFALRLELRESDGEPAQDGPVAVVLLPAAELPPRIEPVTRRLRVVEGRVDLAQVPEWTASVCLVVPGRALVRCDGLSFAGPGAARPQVLGVELEAGRALVGRVVDAATDTPLAGAVVLSETDAPFDHLSLTVDGLPPELAARALTDAEGLFTLEHLRAGTHSLRASAPGFAPSWANAASAADLVSGELTFRLHPGGSIAGRIEDDECAPIAGAIVVISPQEVNREPPFHYALSAADDQGRFRFDDVAAGAYVVIRTGALAQSALMGSVEMLQASVAQGAETRADWICATAQASVSGRVLTAAGEPLPNRILIFSPQGSNGATGWSSTLVGADGDYSIAGLQPGVFDLLLTSGLPSDVVRVGLLDLPFDDAYEHDVTVGPRRIEGRVVLEGDATPADSFVVLLEQDVQRDGTFEFMAQKLIGADGSWSVPYLHAGRYRVRILPVSTGAGGAGVAKASEAREFTVGDQDPEPLEIVLVPGAALALRVLDAAGAPIADARFAAVGGDGRAILEVGRAGTDADGRGEVLGLAAGRVQLRVSAAGYQDATLEIELGAGERHELDVELARERE